MSRRLRRGGFIAATAALLAIAACAPADEPLEEAPLEDEPTDVVPPEEPAEEPLGDAEEPAEPAEDPAEAAETGATLAVEPECAEIGDGFTATATGLEPGVDHVVEIIPAHSEEIDSATMGTAADDGNLEAPASLPEDRDIEAGNYTLALTVFEQDDVLASAELEIAESC